MTEKKLKIVKKNLLILRRANRAYSKANNEQRIKILEKCQFVYDALAEFGVRQDFCEALIVFGREFLLAEYPHLMSEAEREAEEKKRADQQIIDAQRIFGVKATYMTFGERDALALAQKHHALSYKYLGHVEIKKEDGSVKYVPKIKVLIYEKGYGRGGEEK